MKKALVILLILALLPLALYAGGSKEQKPGTPTTLTMWFPAGQITATSLPFRDGSNPWAKYEAENNVKINMVAADYDTMQQKIFTSLAGGTAPDIGFIATTWLGGFIKDDSLVQIPAADAKAWLDAVSSEIVALSDLGGKMYGYPSWGIDAYALTWNKDIFKEVGLDPEKPPKTWEQLREFSKRTAVTNPDGSLKRVGYAIRHLGLSLGIVDKWEWLITSAGAKLNTDAFALKGGKAVINTPDMVKAFQMAHDMVWVDKSTSLNFPDPRDAFLKGNAAFQISELISIQVRQPKEAPNLNWGFAPPPAMNEGKEASVHTATWVLSVFAPSKNQKEALKAIKWFNSEENDFALASKYKSTPRYKANYAKAPFSTDPYVKQFMTLLPFAKPYPLSLSITNVMDVTGVAIQKILHNEMPVEAALKQAEEKANAAIQSIQ